MKIGLQISSLKKFLQTPDDVLDTFMKIRQIGYRYIQIQWIGEGVPPESTRDFLNKSGLICIGTQNSYAEVFEQIEKYIGINELWGSKYAGVSIQLPSVKDEKLQSFKGLASQLNEISGKINERGKILTLHPLFPSYEKINNTSALDEIWQFLDKSIQLQLDTYHVVRAKQDPAEIIKRYRGRMDQVHFKDFRIADQNSDSTLSNGFDILKQGDFPLTPAGQGIVNWREVMEACLKYDVKYCFVEQEAWDKDPFACMKESFDYLTERGAEV